MWRLNYSKINLICIFIYVLYLIRCKIGIFIQYLLQSRKSKQKIDSVSQSEKNKSINNMNTIIKVVSNNTLQCLFSKLLIEISSYNCGFILLQISSTKIILIINTMKITFFVIISIPFFRMRMYITPWTLFLLLQHYSNMMFYHFHSYSKIYVSL